ncbi:hypothetical protein [Streptosporangium sp. KLBMP 9127]|nr:hypothetical protein [Streptosporangium sp. KLBMP 9127]
MRNLLYVGALAVGLLTAGCGQAETGSTAEPVAVGEINSSPTAPSGKARIELGETKLGKVLTGEDGRTLYLFEKDKNGKSSCFGPCAEAWPPFMTEGKPVAGDGVKADLIGTTKREDEGSQVTYNDHPLYYYIQDKQPGDVTGHDIEGFGAEWYAVTAKGEKAKG